MALERLRLQARTALTLVPFDPHTDTEAEYVAKAEATIRAHAPQTNARTPPQPPPPAPKPATSVPARSDRAPTERVADPKRIKRWDDGAFSGVTSTLGGAGKAVIGLPSLFSKNKGGKKTFYYEES